jgi:hypothetical protein
MISTLPQCSSRGSRDMQSSKKNTEIPVDAADDSGSADGATTSVIGKKSALGSTDTRPGEMSDIAEAPKKTDSGTATEMAHRDDDDDVMMPRRGGGAATLTSADAADSPAIRLAHLDRDAPELELGSDDDIVEIDLGDGAWAGDDALPDLPPHDILALHDGLGLDAVDDIGGPGDGAPGFLDD